MSSNDFMKLRTKMGFIQICKMNGMYLEFIHKGQEKIPKGWSEKVYLQACKEAINQNFEAFQFVMEVYKNKMRSMLEE